MSRFNLRSRSTLKLSTQVQCSDCKRNFFDDYNNESDDEKRICVDCRSKPIEANNEEELKDFRRPRAKRQSRQIKIEKIDEDDGSNDISPIANDSNPDHTTNNTNTRVLRDSTSSKIKAKFVHVNSVIFLMISIVFPFHLNQTFK